jgi:hypothetical protein
MDERLCKKKDNEWQYTIYISFDPITGNLSAIA